MQVNNKFQLKAPIKPQAPKAKAEAKEQAPQGDTVTLNGAPQSEALLRLPNR